jgi:hypothetical protein
LCLLVPVIVTACGGVADTPFDAPASPASHTVNVQRSHGGSGTVTSTIGGIACGTTCTASVPTGTVMVLTALADPSAVFAGWSGPCSDREFGLKGNRGGFIAETTGISRSVEQSC